MPPDNPAPPHSVVKGRPGAKTAPPPIPPPCPRPKPPPCPPPPPWPPPPPPCANAAVGASARIPARTRPTNVPFINLISKLSELQFGFTEREGLIGYLDRISAGVMALADASS